MLNSEYETATDGARAALDVARHAAGLALRWKRSDRRMQVAEHRQRDAARRPSVALAKTSSRGSVNSEVDSP